MFKNKQTDSATAQIKNMNGFILPEDVKAFKITKINGGERIKVRLAGMKRPMIVEGPKGGPWHPAKLKLVKETI